jgi:hypothetical protein
MWALCDFVEKRIEGKFVVGVRVKNSNEEVCAM